MTDIDTSRTRTEKLLFSIMVPLIFSGLYFLVLASGAEPIRILLDRGSNTCEVTKSQVNGKPDVFVASLESIKKADIVPLPAKKKLRDLVLMTATNAKVRVDTFNKHDSDEYVRYANEINAFLGDPQRSTLELFIEPSSSNVVMMLVVISMLLYFSSKLLFGWRASISVDQSKRELVVRRSIFYWGAWEKRLSLDDFDGARLGARSLRVRGAPMKLVVLSIDKRGGGTFYKRVIPADDAMVATFTKGVKRLEQLD